MTQVDRFDVEDVLEASGIGGVGTKKRLQCWGKGKKKKVNSVCYCIFIYIYLKIQLFQLKGHWSCPLGHLLVSSW